MNNTALIVKEDGLIYVNRVPEEPKICMSYVLGHCLLTVCSCHDLQKAYETALASAKESAVLVSNHNQAFFIIQDHFMPKGAKEFKLVPGIYPIPGLEWEVKIHCDEYHSHTKPSCGIAILKESTEQHSIRCASYTSDGLQKRGHVPGECDCHLSKTEQEDDLAIRDFSRFKDSKLFKAKQESQEDFDSLCYDLFRPAYHAADTEGFFRRGHHTSGRKISQAQFYELIKLVKENLKGNFTITRKP